MSGLFVLVKIVLPIVGMDGPGNCIKLVGGADLVIMVMKPGGILAALAASNVAPSSVPASQGCSISVVQLSNQSPLEVLHSGTFLIPVNQSGDGASMLTRDTKGKSFVTSTSIFITLEVLPIATDLISFQAVLLYIMRAISSLSSAAEFPEAKDWFRFKCRTVEIIHRTETDEWTNEHTNEWKLEQMNEDTRNWKTWVEEKREALFLELKFKNSNSRPQWLVGNVSSEKNC